MLHAAALLFLLGPSRTATPAQPSTSLLRPPRRWHSYAQASTSAPFYPRTIPPHPPHLTKRPPSQMAQPIERALTNTAPTHLPLEVLFVIMSGRLAQVPAAAWPTARRLGTHHRRRTHPAAGGRCHRAPRWRARPVPYRQRNQQQRRHQGHLRPDAHHRGHRHPLERRPHRRRHGRARRQRFPELSLVVSMALVRRSGHVHPARDQAARPRSSRAVVHGTVARAQLAPRPGSSGGRRPALRSPRPLCKHLHSLHGAPAAHGAGASLHRWVPRSHQSKFLCAEQAVMPDTHWRGQPR